MLSSNTIHSLSTTSVKAKITESAVSREDIKQNACRHSSLFGQEVLETVNTSDGRANHDDFLLEDLWPNFNAMVTTFQESYVGSLIAQQHGFDRDFWARSSNSPMTMLYWVHVEPRSAMSDPNLCATSLFQSVHELYLARLS